MYKTNLNKKQKDILKNLFNEDSENNFELIITKSRIK